MGLVPDVVEQAGERHLVGLVVALPSFVVVLANPAEVIETYSVGNLDYLRASVEDIGAKTVCIDDVEIERKQDPLDALEPATATLFSVPTGSNSIRMDGFAAK
ncbi:hypothetical protein [Haloplanus rubicundus]|uniref:hypothetical protein n=1 Tax=Haloplanus rubicundus TaxID=1547898 RepID=UPI0037429512